MPVKGYNPTVNRWVKDRHQTRPLNNYIILDAVLCHSYRHMKYLFYLIFIPLLGTAQENDRAELVYTQRLSQQFPDSAMTLLKEMVSQSILKKDRLGMGICLQQMGQISYYL